MRTSDFVKLPQIFASYAQSVHGERAEEGVTAAATCTDCHGVHNLGSPEDPTSSISHTNVAQTCGQCHQDIQIEYEASIHGRALRAGLYEAPTCNDCHGEHLILPSSDPPEMVAKYDLQGGVVGSYLDSYHGWATRRGYELAASCCDCHTSHSIQPTSDSTSTVHVSNVAATCGNCHEGADQAFAASYSHESTWFATNPLNRLVRKIYMVVIAVTIGAMLLHQLVIMSYYLVRRRRESKAAGAVRRFDRIQIVQHIVTLLSFWLLVITGFALRFPEATWVGWLSVLGMSEPVRSTLHRVSGVVLILVSISHVLYVLLSRRGREEFRAMIPGLQDVRDFAANMKYYLRLSPVRARLPRYDYMQKAEYWALVWGTAVMAVTGAILWFPTLAVRMLPAISVTISQTIHYYEAWLATLAIVVWHFFFVFFYPGEYPMSWTWLSGKMPEKTVKRHHARWYDEELAQQEPETDVATELQTAE
jgi:formate dehydrogenase gamma subunit